MNQMSPFASRTLAIHLTRGAAAACLALLAVRLLTVANLASAVAGVTALAGVVALLRGCPMCWVVGLIETVAQTFRRTPLP